MTVVGTEAPPSGLQSRDDFVVIGIGASAGGLEAVQELLAGLSPRSDRAYVLVQHLDPNHQSLMPELLSRRTPMPIVPIEDGMPLERGKFYLIPPGSALTLALGVFHLSSFDTPRGLRRPIDVFFQSLAADLGASCGCVVLSGTGSDGSVGLRAVKEAGGLVLVQDPNEAKYDGMPRSAIATNAVDLILPVAEMPEVFDDYFSRSSRLDPTIENDVAFVERVIRHIRYRTGHDFSQYKRSTLRRRLARRMSVLGAQAPQEYLQQLINNHGEANRLFHDILINLTSFFRDPDTFDILRNEAIPRIVSNRGTGEEVRVWVPACSTGQEAYSIAMLIDDELSRRAVRPRVSIFATDIDADAIQLARDAHYPQNIALEVPPEFLDRYFVNSPQGFTVNAAIRDMVRLSHHSVIKDAPFSKLDLVSCRNLMIYFDERLQEQTLQVFHYALKPGGFLFLGPSENVGVSSGQFEALDATRRLYRRNASAAPRLPLPLMAPSLATPPGSTTADPENPRPSDPFQAYERVILARHVAPHVVVDDRNDIVFTSGRTGRYLELPAERAQLDVCELARDGLRPSLRGLLAAVPSEPGHPVHRAFDGEIAGEPIQLVLSAERMPDGRTLIVFQDRTFPEEARGPDGVAVSSVSEEYVRSLESQLEAARQTIRTQIEELETSNEELKSSNEEMMSMNEELQSTNEELSTTNEELKNKIVELNTSNDDQANLAQSIRIATVFLDSSYCIRSFTPEAARYFRLVDRDLGRPFEDIASNLDGESLIGLCRRTIETKTPQETERRSRDDRAYLLVRSNPYVTRGGRVDGVVITLTDVTELRRYAQQLEEAQASATLRLTEIEELYRVTPQAKALLDRDLRFLRVNDRMADINGLPIVEHTGRRAADVVPQLSQVLFRSVQHVFEKGEPITSSGVVSVDSSGSRRVWDIDWYPVRRNAEIFAVGVNIRDITVHKNMEIELRRLMRELQHRVKNMLANVTALVNRARRESGDPKVVLQTLVERIKALGATHNLLTSQNWRPMLVADILRPELVDVYGEGRISLRGPDIHVNARTTLALAMAVHELATNAAKYGALSTEEGRLAVHWLRIDEGEGERLVLHWKEQLGPPLAPPERLGFGTQLIKATVEGSMNGRFDFKFGPSGYSCTISIPLDRATGEEGDAAAEVEAAESPIH
ncbi:chemotaxis protein CheB [Reyranella sp.]|uniref:chemotaxis protein CheB n=1 Tax=Reyranella sp. TaxID=1929291 RepID=UPI003BAD16BE